MPASAQSSHGGGVWSYFGFGDRDGGRHFSDDHGGREPHFGVGGGRPHDVHPAPLPLAGAGLPALGLALSAYGLVRAQAQEQRVIHEKVLLAKRCPACHGSARGSARFWSASIAHDHRPQKMLKTWLTITLRRCKVQPTKNSTTLPSFVE